MPSPHDARPGSTVNGVFAFLLALVVVASGAARLVPGAGAAQAAEPGRPTTLGSTLGSPALGSPALGSPALGSPALGVVPHPPAGASANQPEAGSPRPPAPGTTPPARATGPSGPAGNQPAPASGPSSGVVVNLPAGSGAVTAPAPPASALQQAQPLAAKWLPSGKGMWIYEPAKTESGNAAAIVARAKAAGLTHLWVRMGSAWDGFNVAPFLDRLLPAAHAAGLKVIGWDFPKLDPVDTDVKRAATMMRYTTPSGDRVDAFSPDIESPAEGTHLTPDAARRYGEALRQVAGPDYPLIVTVPRPAKERPQYPYADIVAGYDAIAPMVYWLNRQPDSDVIAALATLATFGKPVYPVGQAYDGSPEGGRKGVPPPDELFRFMRAAESHGAAGISFWSWQAADQPAWNAIRDALEFRLPDPSTLGGTQKVDPLAEMWPLTDGQRAT